MSKVNLMIGEKAITVAYDGKLETIIDGDHRYNTVLRAIRNGNTEDLPRLLDPSRMFEHIPHVELVDGRVQIKGKAIPDGLTQRVLNFKDKGLPFEPLLKFSEKLMQNPSYNSREMLYTFLEHNGHPLTMDGNFIAYKAVRKDFMDIHSGTMSNAVGKTVSMPRDQVDDNPNNTCSSGLHVATHKYAKDFGGGGGGFLLEIEIDPANVVAVPNDYNGQKMRVCQYVVRKVCENILEDVDLYEEAQEIGYGDLVVMRDAKDFNPIGKVQDIIDGMAIVNNKYYELEELETVKEEVDAYGNTPDYYGFIV